MKKILSFLIVVMMLFFLVSAFAAEKVVVVPLTKSSPNLVPENIKAGVELFGVLGDYPPDTCMTTYRDNCTGSCVAIFGITPESNEKCPQLCNSLMNQLDACLQ